MAPIDKVNSPRTLLEAEIVSINGRTVEPAPAKVELRLSPVPRVVVTFRELRLPDDRAFLPGEFWITFSTDLRIPVQLGFFERYSNGYSGNFLMSKDPVEVRRTGDSLRRVQFAVVNFSRPFGRFPTNQVATVTLDTPPWSISLRQVENFKELMGTLSQQGGYGITHYGEITQSGNFPFSIEDVQLVLEQLGLYLSFVRGTFCGLTLASGFDQRGELAWESWGPGFTSDFWSKGLVIGEAESEILQEQFPIFCNSFSSFGRGSPAANAIRLYLASAESAIVENKIVLTCAALEALAFQILGPSKKGYTGERIAEALKKKDIDPSVSKGLPPRNNGQWKHGPHCLVAIRNNLVHPEQRIPPVSLEGLINTWLLGQQYAYQLILKVVYEDRHRS